MGDSSRSAKVNVPSVFKKKSVIRIAMNFTEKINFCIHKQKQIAVFI